MTFRSHIFLLCLQHVCGEQLSLRTFVNQTMTMNPFEIWFSREFQVNLNVTITFYRPVVLNEHLASRTRSPGVCKSLLYLILMHTSLIQRL